MEPISQPAVAQALLRRPLVFTLGLGTYIAAYAAWPKIKEIMIDPYYKEEEPEYIDEPIMRDVI